jgi:hypothetical protein
MAVAPRLVTLRAPRLPAPLAALAALVLAGCTGNQSARAPVPAPPRGPAVDASYDWRGQVTVPFGVLFKSSPVPLHEVLLFNDGSGAAAPGAARGAADAEMRDCYAIDGTPPRLVGHTPDAYLLCFDHDRLNRIESSVRLAPETAAQVFAAACASWRTDVPLAQAAAGVCEGQSGTTTFTAHLVSAPGEPSTFSLVLSNANPVP